MNLGSPPPTLPTPKHPWLHRSKSWEGGWREALGSVAVGKGAGRTPLLGKELPQAGMGELGS